ncbi:MAG TPA: TolC family protein [Candidatus Acidoferrales bacterium]|nr:TolC family protein [Candidatus Acidoferrales bacterium]
MKRKQQELSAYAGSLEQTCRPQRHVPARKLFRIRHALLFAAAVAFAVAPALAQSNRKSQPVQRTLLLSSTPVGSNRPLGIAPGHAQSQVDGTPAQNESNQQQTPPTAPGPEAQPQVQLIQPPGPNQAGAPVTITLQDALARAKKYDAQFQSILYDAKSATEDSVQARNAILPNVSATTQALLTQGYGPGRPVIGRFVTQDGVHVYRAWGVVNEDLSPANYLFTTYNHARAAQAVAQAKAEIARRGLNVTVTQLYYNVAVAQRKYATGQAASDAAKHFYQITQDAERVGQVSHSDVIQAEVQYQQQEQAFDEAELAMNKARLDLAVVIFPQLNVNFTVVDDLDTPVSLPPFAEAQQLAARGNPDLAVAMQTLRQAKTDVVAARGAFLPDFTATADYGIEANYFALHSVNVEFPEAGVLPNLGYFLQVGVNIPVWDWGTLRSKLHQAEYKRDAARIELSQTQRQLLNNLYSSYNEALVASDSVTMSRRTAELAAESLRLINLRYQAGETAALDVVTAENTLTQTRNAYADAELRYRVAIATLQTVTGSF